MFYKVIQRTCFNENSYLYIVRVVLLFSLFRVVHVSGGLAKGALSKCSAEKRARFVDTAISMEELIALINQFIE